jgi:hypothetical protein
MGSYQHNFSEFAVSAIDMLASKTLAAQDLTNLSANTAANLPASTTAIAYPSGGTYTGAAASPQYSGATFAITSSAGGAVASIKVIDRGPNVGTAAETIIFDAASLQLAFNTAAITGSVTATLAGGDLERPSGTFNGRLPSIYVGSAGNVKVTLAEDTQPIILTGLTANTFVPMTCKQIFNLSSDTDTTVTNLLALF